jgi:hypothetical protein
MLLREYWRYPRPIWPDYLHRYRQPRQLLRFPRYPLDLANLGPNLPDQRRKISVIVRNYSYIGFG